jgi:hypothetical protein
MIKNKMQDDKSIGGASEKKNEEATINTILVVTTKSKAHEEVTFQEKELLKRQEP